jgi:hypothetical protein
MTASADPLSRAVARVELTTLLVGAAATVYEFATSGWRAALAIAVGSLVSWLNYRWLRAGVLSLAPPAAATAAIPAPPSAKSASAPESAPGYIESAPQPATRASGKAFLKFFTGFVLLLAVLYVILSRSLLPAPPLLAGLFAAVAAVILQMVYLLASGGVAKAN